MSWLGDALKFENFNLKEMFKTVKDNPERLFLGALTPVGTKAWGGLLGKDWESPLNYFGGPSDETFRKAEEAGIDTGGAQGIHNVAEGIAASYAGGYGLDQLGAGGLGGGGGDGGGGFDIGKLLQNMPNTSGGGGMPVLPSYGKQEDPAEKVRRQHAEELLKQALRLQAQLSEQEARRRVV